MIEATVDLMRFGWSFLAASVIVIPWFITCLQPSLWDTLCCCCHCLGLWPWPQPCSLSNRGHGHGHVSWGPQPPLKCGACPLPFLWPSCGFLFLLDHLTASCYSIGNLLWIPHFVILIPQCEINHQQQTGISGSHYPETLTMVTWDVVPQFPKKYALICCVILNW